MHRANPTFLLGYINGRQGKVANGYGDNEQLTKVDGVPFLGGIYAQ